MSVTLSPRTTLSTVSNNSCTSFDTSGDTDNLIAFALALTNVCTPSYPPASLTSRVIVFAVTDSTIIGLLNAGSVDLGCEIGVTKPVAVFAQENVIDSSSIVT